MSKSDKIVHGIKLSRAWFPPRPVDVIEQYVGIVRGRRFLFIERLSPGRTYKDWEAHEYNVEINAYRGGMVEFSRALSSIVQLVIDGVELRSMNRLKPPAKRKGLTQTKTTSIVSAPTTHGAEQ